MNREVNTRSVYKTDCLRRIQDAETGEQRIARMEETRAVSVTLSVHEGRVFWKGARVA